MLPEKIEFGTLGTILLFAALFGAGFVTGLTF